MLGLQDIRAQIALEEEEEAQKAQQEAQEGTREDDCCKSMGKAEFVMVMLEAEEHQCVLNGLLCSQYANLSAEDRSKSRAPVFTMLQLDNRRSSQRIAAGSYEKSHGYERYRPNIPQVHSKPWLSPLPPRVSQPSSLKTFLLCSHPTYPLVAATLLFRQSRVVYGMANARTAWTSYETIYLSSPGSILIKSQMPGSKGQRLVLEAGWIDTKGVSHWQRLDTGKHGQLSYVWLEEIERS